MKTAVGNETPEVKQAIGEAVMVIQNMFREDVLSGKLPRDPPIRGPFGLAKISLRAGAQPKRQRCFQLGASGPRR